MKSTQAKKQKATFWQYTGSHPDGKDCRRQNDYGYPLTLIQYLHFYGGEDLSIHAGSSFLHGRTVTVEAPQSTWEEAWIKCAKELGAEVAFDEIFRDEYGEYWGRIQGCYEGEDRLYQLFYQDDEETELEFIKKGFVPVSKDADGDTLWIELSEIKQEG